MVALLLSVPPAFPIAFSTQFLVKWCFMQVRSNFTEPQRVNKFDLIAISGLAPECDTISYLPWFMRYVVMALRNCVILFIAPNGCWNLSVILKYFIISMINNINNYSACLPKICNSFEFISTKYVIIVFGLSCTTSSEFVILLLFIFEKKTVSLNWSLPLLLYFHNEVFEDSKSKVLSAANKRTEIDRHSDTQTKMRKGFEIGWFCNNRIILLTFATYIICMQNVWIVSNGRYVKPRLLRSKWFNWVLFYLLFL